MYAFVSVIEDMWHVVKANKYNKILWPENY